MLVSNLGELFEIAEYRPNVSGRASLELVDTEIHLRFPMTFFSTAGTESHIVMVTAVATQQQLDQMKAFLINVLQATNTAIESEHGWTKYVEPIEP